MTDIVSYRRPLLLLQLNVYRRIVERKHGLPVLLSAAEIENMAVEDLASFVDSLRDMAHLPPQ